MMIQIALFLFLFTPQWDLTTSTTFVRGVSSDGQQGLWCATTGGVLRFVPGEGVAETYSYPSRLPHPKTSEVIQDSEGRLWVATERGLAMLFNGQTTVFTEFEGIPGSGLVYSVIEAGNHIWTGSDGGLARGDDQGFIPISGAFTPSRVYGMDFRSDTLWLVTERGVYSLNTLMSPFDPDAWKNWPATMNLTLRGIEVTSLGICAYGASGVVALLPGYDDFRLILGTSTVITGVAELNGLLLAARKGEVLQWRNGVWENLPPGIPGDVTPSFLKSVDGRLWMGYGVADPQMEVAGRGLLLRQDGNWVRSDLPGMPCMSVFQIVLKPDGRIYSGTYIRGLQAFYPGGGWRVFTSDNSGFPNNQSVFSVTDWAGPGIWAASYHYGLTWVNDNGTFNPEDDQLLTFCRDSLAQPVPPSTVLVPADLPNNQVTMLARQGQGVWAAHERYWEFLDEPSGITGFRGDPGSQNMTWAVRTEAQGLAFREVRGVFPQGSDSLWVTFKEGNGCQLLVHSGDPSDPSRDTWFPGFGQAFTTESGLPSNEVYSVLPVPGKGVYIGTASGLARFTSTGIVQVPGVSGAVRTLARDGAGRIWAVGNSGVTCLEGTKVYFFSSGNSAFIPSSRPGMEHSVSNLSTGEITFSSEIGIWRVTTGGGGVAGDGPLFYPQPFLPAQGEMRLAGITEPLPVRVEFYSVDGAFLDAVEAETPSQWSWDGTFNRARAASGVYMVLVRHGETVVPRRIAVVR